MCAGIFHLRTSLWAHQKARRHFPQISKNQFSFPTEGPLGSCFRVGDKHSVTLLPLNQITLDSAPHLDPFDFCAFFSFIGLGTYNIL